MNRTRLALILFSLSVLVLTGCAPDPGDVCAKLESIYSQSPDKPAFLKTRDECVESFERKKSKNGVNSYRREAECILSVTRPYAATECMEKEAGR